MKNINFTQTSATDIITKDRTTTDRNTTARAASGRTTIGTVTRRWALGACVATALMSLSGFASVQAQTGNFPNKPLKILPIP